MATVQDKYVKNPLVIFTGIRKYKKPYTSLEITEKDRILTKQLWHDKFNFNYYVEIWRDKKGIKADKFRLKLINTLNNFSERKQNKCDGLIFVFSGHGNPNTMTFSDGKDISTTELQNIFNNIFYLKNKPKIIYIDPYRGNKIYTSTNTDSESKQTSDTFIHNTCIPDKTTTFNINPHGNFLIRAMHNIYNKNYNKHKMGKISWSDTRTEINEFMTKEAVQISEMKIQCRYNIYIVPKKVHFDCTQCSKRFKHVNSLNQHVRIHRDDCLICEHCDKKFDRKSNLVKHIRIHTDERPYKCSYCESAFKQKIDVTRHMRIHTGERPFKCSFCEKAFKKSFNLRRHMRIHTDERPYRCSYCIQRFNQKAHLDNHERIHRGEKPYQCKKCKKMFRQSGECNAHMKKCKKMCVVESIQSKKI